MDQTYPVHGPRNGVLLYRKSHFVGHHFSVCFFPDVNFHLALANESQKQSRKLLIILISLICTHPMGRRQTPLTKRTVLCISPPYSSSMRDCIFHLAFLTRSFIKIGLCHTAYSRRHQVLPIVTSHQTITITMFLDDNNHCSVGQWRWQVIW